MGMKRHAKPPPDLADALAEAMLRVETDDPLVRQWLNALALRGERVSSENPTPRPPPAREEGAAPDA